MKSDSAIESAFLQSEDYHFGHTKPHSAGWGFFLILFRQDNATEISAEHSWLPIGGGELPDGEKGMALLRTQRIFRRRPMSAMSINRPMGFIAIWI